MDIVFKLLSNGEKFDPELFEKLYDSRSIIPTNNGVKHSSEAIYFFTNEKKQEERISIQDIITNKCQFGFFIDDLILYSTL